MATVGSGLSLSGRLVKIAEAKVLGDSAEEYFYNSFIRGEDS